jgi:hypothetical protein
MELSMSKDARNAKPTITDQLDALFDQVGVEALNVSFAQAIAEAEGLNRTSAQIRFYGGAPRG